MIYTPNKDNDFDTMIYTPYNAEGVSDYERVEKIKAIMLERGAPTIRACWQGDHYCAIEGSARLLVAHELGIKPNIIEVEEDDLITDHDLKELPKEVTVGEILERFGWNAAAYKFTLDD